MTRCSVAERARPSASYTSWLGCQRAWSVMSRSQGKSGESLCEMHAANHIDNHIGLHDPSLESILCRTNASRTSCALCCGRRMSCRAAAAASAPACWRTHRAHHNALYYSLPSFPARGVPSPTAADRESGVVAHPRKTDPASYVGESTPLLLSLAPHYMMARLRHSVLHPASAQDFSGTGGLVLTSPSSVDGVAQLARSLLLLQQTRLPGYGSST